MARADLRVIFECPRSTRRLGNQSSNRSEGLLFGILRIWQKEMVVWSAKAEVTDIEEKLPSNLRSLRQISGWIVEAQAASDGCSRLI